MLCKIYDMLYDSPLFLSDFARAALKNALDRFGGHFTRLREFSLHAGALYFQVTPKVHAMQHLYTESLLLNPRFCQCYSQESMVGRVTAVWRACANGPYKQTVQRSATLRYLVLWALELDL